MRTNCPTWPNHTNRRVLNVRHLLLCFFFSSSCFLSFDLALSICFLTRTLLYSLPTQHSPLLFFQMRSSFSSLLTPTLCLFFKREEKETDWPLQGPKAWGNPYGIVGLLCPSSQDFPHSSTWESKSTGLHSAENTGLHNHVDRWRGTLLYLQRKTWYKNVLLPSTLEGAAACQSRYS